ncbi:bifunctional 5,10-methylene-tetrahydrofolate dehydrogenase/5,10-methylene-tetrahydrofolate cyclohydrolase [Loigolactobacillus backii]|uniref:Bifunctional protein FolD n=2 Tax=Loigolactobacillus backii TaxID=375175 RepID=A0A192H5S6_9LACO|nr:bifunctional 5,10-methylene-tetrahydrofolate dehydrogenase/5,10-methylene-tetrahydrofolate cyclohydrolase [Loigolactobacillus backii]ANK63583.1 bifunctional 5,10-methylene-tetrahydrofolate dehydrogenase/5,10-methylene-tetrahydrofolate cyclohydrolase [Loigolactobacillus backii]ANK65861.1 bifunctional 5,10-methylene-tetrahydrofolate dehydrogenase/5,10-methylene-tetrahydrofolate cyclohydrolase [Loigolactobacillus backii]ANK68350.1 bifunctional 5,10-methylene-tetrahydrofolate dehydrogenase/5,10-m
MADLTLEVAQLKQQGVVPCLAVVIVGDDPASHVYLRSKQRRAKKLGIRVLVKALAETATEAAVLKVLAELNQDPKINAILVEMPLPKQINQQHILEAINPAKDVDGFHPINLGQLFAGTPRNIPNTPYGVMKLLAHYQIPLAGKNAVVIGRSVIVGRPMAALLMNQNATVTVAHSYTTNLSALTKQADVLVVAAGKANFIHGDAIKPGATVIDVGMNRTAAGKLVGDVSYQEASQVASAITPVPGGVGPMTITMLMYQIVKLTKGVA